MVVMEQPEVIDTHCLSFRSATEAQPAAMTYISVVTAMFGAIMFGIDAGNFGATIDFEGFKNHWCVNMGWGFPNSDKCEYEIDGVMYKNRTGKCALGPGCFAEGDGPDSYSTTFIALGNVLITLGAAVAAVALSPRVADKHGRRMCISLGCFVVFCGCVLTVISGTFPTTPPPNEDPRLAPFLLNWFPITTFYVSRFMTGFGVGLCCYALPMYSAEIATPGIRGRSGGMFQFNCVLGSFISSIVTRAMNIWQVGVMLPGMASIIVTVLIWMVPESPRWALKNQGLEAAAQILRRVRKGDVQAELAAIQEGLDAEKDLVQLTYADLFKPGLRNRVFVACFMQVAQQLTGVNAILGLSSLFFKQMGMPESFSNGTFLIIFNAVMLLGVICGLAILDSAYGGRRKQLMIAALLMGPPLFIAGSTLGNKSVGWGLGATMILIYAWGFQFAWGTVPWVYPSEIFSMSERIKAMSLAVFFQYGANTAVYWISPALVHWNMSATLYIFGCFNLMGLLFIFFCVKETKGVPLEMVPQLFSRRQALAKSEMGDTVSTVSEP
jgi:sugar porter (SP) family MFS transporter